MTPIKWLKTPIKGLILDISGVLKDGDVPIPGSVEAVKVLQSSGIPFRLVTNESLKTRSNLKNTLNLLGYDVPERDMFCPIPALKEILKEENLRPHLLVHEKVMEEFKDVDVSDPNCVVIGDAEEFFTYQNLNECFRKLMSMENPVLFSLGFGKYYMDEGGLVLDVGSYCKGLEYATGVKARIIGKPSKDYFLTAVKDLGLQPDEVAMVGDDIENDVGGAQAAGIRGLLVRTGKFRPSDETHHNVTPDAIVDNLKQAIDTIISNQANTS